MEWVKEGSASKRTEKSTLDCQAIDNVATSSTLPVGKNSRPVMKVEWLLAILLTLARLKAVKTSTMPWRIKKP